MKEEWSRTAMLIGPEAVERLAHARIAIFGLGGVGGHVAEALARSGVGALDLIDNDSVSLSNINRQILADHTTVGRLKTEVAKERVQTINPEIRVRTFPVFYLPETAGQFDFSEYDYVVDAIDTVTAKVDLIIKAQEAGTPIICAMGTGNKLDPTAFCVTDIYKTAGCPLAKVMRTELRKRGVESLKVLYSLEPPRKPFFTPAGESPRTPASIAFVPAVAGLILAGEVIKDITGVR